jgi:hypothetical protein
MFAGNVGSIAACLWAHAILIVGRYRYLYAPSTMCCHADMTDRAPESRRKRCVKTLASFYVAHMVNTVIQAADCAVNLQVVCR